MSAVRSRRVGQESPDDGNEREWGRQPARTIWFHRDFIRLTGGHLKHSHYFDHVVRLPGFSPRIVFSPTTDGASAVDRQGLWPTRGPAVVERWAPEPKDVLFLAGLDWRYVFDNGFANLPNPRINLIQHVRHAQVDAAPELYRYLHQKAIRICVSQEVADAISADGQTDGPILTIPNGTDLLPFHPSPTGSPVGFDTRSEPIVIVGYKSPELARAVSGQLHAEGIEHRVLSQFMDRHRFLDQLGRSKVAVCLPHETEGFYLPALEAMAVGCIVVSTDCVGNRGFCGDGGSCLVADRSVTSLVQTTKRALGLREEGRARLHTRGREMVMLHSLEAERSRFHEILENVDHAWGDGTSVSFRLDEQASRSAECESGVPQPVIEFMIVGAQRCGTTSLAWFLSQHPEIAMSSPKEAHLFDRPDYSPDWTTEQINARYRRFFKEISGARIRGEATPIYLFLPEIARELKRYNPELKVLVLLRDPVERTISSYRFQKSRGKERLPLWLALLVEPLRMRRCRDPRIFGSLTRLYAYRRRGLYSYQLRNLHRFFNPKQVLLIRTRDLANQHDAVLRRVFEFLGVSPNAPIAPEFLNQGNRDGKKHRVVSWALRLAYRSEFARMRTVLKEIGNVGTRGAVKV